MFLFSSFCFELDFVDLIAHGVYILTFEAQNLVLVFQFYYWRLSLIVSFYCLHLYFFWRGGRILYTYLAIKFEVFVNFVGCVLKMNVL